MQLFSKGKQKSADNDNLGGCLPTALMRIIQLPPSLNEIRASKNCSPLTANLLPFSLKYHSPLSFSLALSLSLTHSLTLSLSLSLSLSLYLILPVLPLLWFKMRRSAFSAHRRFPPLSNFLSYFARHTSPSTSRGSSCIRAILCTLLGQQSAHTHVKISIDNTPPPQPSRRQTF